MSEQLTVRELLAGGDSFDPLNLNTSEIRALSESMPKDGNIDVNNAEVLATKFLRGADICAELLAVATAHVAKMDAVKKKAYSYAALVKASANNIKTDKSRAWFADMDEDYVNACNKHAEAIAFAKWVDGKYDAFNKMHYLCKKILERGYTHERMSSFNGDQEKMVEDAEKNPAW